MKQLSLRISRVLMISIIFISIFSCGSKQEMLYFQDEILENYEQPFIRPEISYKPGDVITIDVTGLDLEAVRPFNLPIVSYASSVASAQQDATKQTYLIDKNGEIDFPVLGTLKLEGLTRIEATNQIKEKLKQYIKGNVVVNIRLANFTISVLGEVNNPGTFTILDERVSLAEAIGLAGDLTIYGNRQNVLLIREVNSQKRFAKFDLTSVKSLASLNYYLEQNDVIYVQPNQTRVNSSKYNQNTGVIISAVATLVTIAALIIK